MKSNRILGVIGLALSVIYLVAAIRMPSPGLTDAIGPRGFPILVGVLGIVISLALLLEHRFNKNLKQPVVSIERRQALYILLLVLICIVYALLFETLGFLISSLFFLSSILFLLNRGRWIQNLVIAVGFSFLFYFIFYNLLGISLPRGILAF